MKPVCAFPPAHDCRCHPSAAPPLLPETLAVAPPIRPEFVGSRKQGLGFRHLALVEKVFKAL